MYGSRNIQGAQPAWRNGWVVTYNGVDLCMAISQPVAVETAFCLTVYRSTRP